MGQRVRVTFDGQVLRPEEPVAIQPGTRCVVIVEDDHSDQAEQTEYLLTSLARLASDLGVTDLAERHTEYAHGQGSEGNGS